MAQAKLIDAQEMARLHPHTFFAPSQKELDALKVGLFVKIGTDTAPGERFWAKVTEIHGNTVVGIVDNELIHTGLHGYACYDQIEFKKTNIYNIMEA